MTHAIRAGLAAALLAAVAAAGPASAQTAKKPAKAPAKATPAVAPDAAGDDGDEGDDPDSDDADDDRASNAASPAGVSSPSMRPLMGAGDDPRASADGIFFGDKLDTEESARGTLWQGSVTASSFVYAEQADTFRLAGTGNVDLESASPLTRYFSEVRGQLDAKHMFGGRWDARLDTRIRVAPGDTLISTGSPTSVPSGRQSGYLGGNEYELRELYVVRGGDRTDVFVGRQFVLELAAVKFDGVRLSYALSEDLNLIAFGGLYPVRGSRSLDSDYPAGVDQNDAGMRVESGRVLPITGGAGAAYRLSMAYGSVGAVAIAPTTNDVETGAIETTRIFVTANGYERFGPTLDLYHFLVLDVTGAGGFGVTNGSLGVNWAPSPRLRVTANVHHVDTETLNVQAQTLLETPDTLGPGGGGLPGLVQNNIEVQRIASDAARLGVSVSLGAQRRFELSVHGGYRQREEIELKDGQNAPVVVPGAKGSEVTFQAIDRRSILGLRISALASRFFGLGDENFHRSESLAARLSASREFARGRGEWEVEAGYLYAKDDNPGGACAFDPAMMAGSLFANCYGSSTLSAPSLGGLVSWRFATDWFALASVNASLQSLTLKDLAADQSQPVILGTTGFVRLGYRF